MRQGMKERFGIGLQKELHAKHFLAGRKPIAPQPIDIPTRVNIARDILKGIAAMPSMQVIGVVMEHDEKDRAFDWLLNRIDTNVRKASDQALIISDEGKDYNKLLDRKRKTNLIPSAFGGWRETGGLNTSIPIANIVERIWLRKSSDCHFIQAADFCAYALLRQEAPYAKHTALGIDKLYSALEPCLCKDANRKDPQGVVRWKKTR